MKKSLSVVLAAALAFGSMSSMAFAADNALTASDKYKQLVDKGILKGTTTGSDELDSKLTRAQFATIAIALAGIQEDTGSTSTFTDVTTKQWWFGAIEAAAKAELVKGIGNDKFAPRDDVTVESVIVVAARIAKLTPVEGAKVEGASEYAVGYIQAAIDAGLTAARTDYKEAATRGQTAELAFAVYGALNPVAPAKVSVASAKASNYNEVTVTLDKAVDTEKATLTLKRGTATVATTTKWSDDKKTATLSLTSAKISEADYSVTLAGIAAEEIATATASFKGENEKVTKLEFVTTSDDIAASANARVKLRAENQYGKLASLNASNYSINADTKLNASITKNSEGFLIVKLDTIAFGGTQGLSQIPIYVYSNDNHLTAFKTFKLGFEPFVTKSELSEIKYDNGKKALINSGDTGTAELAIYDQYGNPMAVSTTPTAKAPTFNHNILPYAQDVKFTTGDFDNDDEYEVRVSLDKKTDKAQAHTLTVYVGSSSSNTTFDIGTSKVATTVEFESYDGTLATSDSGKLVTFNAYDANGDKLTAAEIAENAKIVAPATTGRFNLTASGVDSAEIVTVGPDKGKIRLGNVTAPKNSVVFITLSILSQNANSIKTLQIPVADVRVPASLSVKTAPHAKAVLGASSKFVLEVKDQYGDVVTTNIAPATAEYRVVYAYNAGTTTDTFTGTDSANMSVSGATYNFDALNDDHHFVTKVGEVGTASLKATLQKLDKTVTPNVWRDTANPVTVSIDSIDHTKTELNYSIADITSLYATLDNKALFPALSEAQLLIGKTAKSIELTVKDNAGNSVAYPSGMLTDVTTSNSAIARVNGATSVLGNKVGEASVTGVVYKANGETATLTAKVTVKNDAIVAEKVETKGNVDSAALAVGFDLATAMEVKLTDNYGKEYNATDARTDYSQVTGLRYTVSEMTNAAVSINPTTGEINTVSVGTTYQFVVTVTAPNGKTASTIFFKK